ncbi:MAG: hypothetical protein KAI83_16715 [Thiomargarita sp.]|nr:hypothetical protein [Thiomargarita sp.]
MEYNASALINLEYNASALINLEYNALALISSHQLINGVVKRDRISR